MGQLTKLQELVKQEWNQGDLLTNYPFLNSVHDFRHRCELLKHLQLHIAKANGKFAEACEVLDHGGGHDGHAFQHVLQRLLVNTLQLANMLGYKEEGLLAIVNEWVEERRENARCPRDSGDYGHL